MHQGHNFFYGIIFFVVLYFFLYFTFYLPQLRQILLLCRLRHLTLLLCIEALHLQSGNSRQKLMHLFYLKELGFYLHSANPATPLLFHIFPYSMLNFKRAATTVAALFLLSLFFLIFYFFTCTLHSLL